MPSPFHVWEFEPTQISRFRAGGEVGENALQLALPLRYGEVTEEEEEEDLLDMAPLLAENSQLGCKFPSYLNPQKSRSFGKRHGRGFGIKSESYCGHLEGPEVLPRPRERAQ